MTKADTEERDGRVLLLTPTGRDAALTGRYLSAAGIRVAVCAGMAELCERSVEGAGAALIAEEAPSPENARRLLDTLDRQPAWSDFPLVVLTSRNEAAPGGADALKSLGEAWNVTLVERPTRSITGKLPLETRQIELAPSSRRPSTPCGRPPTRRTSGTAPSSTARPTS